MAGHSVCEVRQVHDGRGGVDGIRDAAVLVSGGAWCEGDLR